MVDIQFREFPYNRFIGGNIQVKISFKCYYCHLFIISIQCFIALINILKCVLQTLIQCSWVHCIISTRRLRKNFIPSFNLLLEFFVPSLGFILMKPCWEHISELGNLSLHKVNLWKKYCLIYFLFSFTFLINLLSWSFSVFIVRCFSNFYSLYWNVQILLY